MRKIFSAALVSAAACATNKGFGRNDAFTQKFWNQDQYEDAYTMEVKNWNQLHVEQQGTWVNAHMSIHSTDEDNTQLQSMFRLDFDDNYFDGKTGNDLVTAWTNLVPKSTYVQGFCEKRQES